MELRLPEHVSTEHRDLLREVAQRNEVAHGDGLLGLVLSGSAGRGLAASRSDVDVYVVLTDIAAAQRTADRSDEVDELPVAMSELQAVPSFGTPGWWFRWSFAWAPVLLDRTEGAITKAVRRQATLTPDEIDAVLLDASRLDGWLNYTYRALKSDRDDRPLERRLDAAESMPWLLDVVFALAGRVRPYHKYLPWELREQPVRGWPAEDFLPLLASLLDGEPRALREVFARVEAQCAAHDVARGHRRTEEVIAGWGEGLALLRGVHGAD
ncbi:hypothetical protein [Quadrisphaera sp. INWT6]|uniref:hypothetical protein n=1 Tax=Quadrisphaera sp. INWT6 TaxID=2596917 RepID=UPI0018924A78|nr:hypothetical protein [Quadrisphaera sp. INWT6]MBF5083080.1 hypothetical protein [Quadrisphaera sp. INWT6]